MPPAIMPFAAWSFDTSMIWELCASYLFSENALCVMLLPLALQFVHRWIPYLIIAA